MKCPLLKIARAGLENEAAYPLDDCLKGECAWWDIITERCAVKELAVELRSANAILVKMGQNMTLR